MSRQPSVRHRTRPGVRRAALASLLAGVLAGSPLLAAAPATARDTFTTTTVASTDATSVAWRETIDIDVDVDSSSGFSPTDGTVSLLAREAGATTWTEVATTTPGTGFLGVRPRMTTVYKVVYGGYEPTAAREDTYKSSESLEFIVQVSRTITYPTGGFVLKGRVRPQYGNKVLVVQASSTRGSGYKRYTKVRTDARGRYTITLPRREGRWYWLVKAKGDARYLPTSFQWETWVS